MCRVGLFLHLPRTSTCPAPRNTDLGDTLRSHVGLQQQSNEEGSPGGSSEVHAQDRKTAPACPHAALAKRTTYSPLGREGQKTLHKQMGTRTLDSCPHLLGDTREEETQAGCTPQGKTKDLQWLLHSFRVKAKVLPVALSPGTSVPLRCAAHPAPDTRALGCLRKLQVLPPQGLELSPPRTHKTRRPPSGLHPNATGSARPS